ncbi:hypothetical protein A1Q2_04963 [Trichosporon asahii var. asahii CBS 8904]|uniref:Transcription initiation factor TFIID subunit 13 n=1 Tax=Trichosporon asahii var. asahii (strain CBS 8904) TaxID=1220162 RepID=K1VJ21_TRIAC|nr:hypothetical protein A1Q2_04963 [Trichosporon asahii var. asahii CBS 8904]
MSESPAVPSSAPVSAPVTATASAAATPTPTPPPVPAVPAAPVAAPAPAPVAVSSPAPAPTPPATVPVPAAPTVAPAPASVPPPVVAQASSPAVATPSGPSPAVTPISTAVPTPAQAPSPAAASPAPQTPALSQATITQLAIFYASQHHQQALAAYNAKPTGNPPQPMSQQQAQQLFLRLPPQQQRQVQATFIARQRIAAQQATQSPQRSPTSPAPPSTATPYHPSLLGSGGSTAPTTPTQPAQQPPAPAPQPQPQPQAQARPPPPPQPAAPAPPPARQRPATSQSKSKQQSNLRTVSFVPQDEPETGADRSRRREEGFRGSMRGEIATLMYAAGDVKEPDVDSVDFVEDMVVEFLADLCRPVPPIRPTANATHTAVPLSADTLRHRLASQPYLRKYLERWDDMTYMWQELQASRRVAQPNHQDLIADLGKQFLGLDEQDGPAAKRRALEGADGEPKRRGRPPKNPEERKKPGPKKGWKKNLDPNAPPKKRNARANYKKRDRASASIAPPSPSKASTPAP